VVGGYVECNVMRDLRRTVHEVSPSLLRNSAKIVDLSGKDGVSNLDSHISPETRLIMDDPSPQSGKSR
jgi:hypothetical protein